MTYFLMLYQSNIYQNVKIRLEICLLMILPFSMTFHYLAIFKLHDFPGPFLVNTCFPGLTFFKVKFHDFSCFPESVATMLPLLLHPLLFPVLLPPLVFNAGPFLCLF